MKNTFTFRLCKMQIFFNALYLKHTHSHKIAASVVRLGYFYQFQYHRDALCAKTDLHM